MSNREAFEKICPAEEGVKIEWSEKRQKYYHNKIQGQLITGKYTRERDKMLRVWQSAEQYYKAEIEKYKQCLVDIENTVDNISWGHDGDCGLGRRIDRLIEALKEPS